MATNYSTDKGIYLLDYHNGAKLHIAATDLGDYASGRASQLAALMRVINAANQFEELDMTEVTRNNVQWLAMSMADEQESLAELLCEALAAKRNGVAVPGQSSTGEVTA